MMVGDVTVVGLDPSTTVLYDIGMDVPARKVVTIPAEKAASSKDLWRAINQRRLFQLHAGPVNSTPVRPAPLPSTGYQALQDKCRNLETENARLREAVSALQERLNNQPQPVGVVMDARLDQILDLLRSGVVTASPSDAPARPTRKAAPQVVEVEAPTFIPNEIKPKNVEGRITEVRSETSDNTALDSAASALRKFRAGKQ